MTKKYDEDSIEWYKGLSGVRRQPSVYIGPLGNPAILHMLREAVENSVDECVDGNNNYVAVKIENNVAPQIFTIVDKGRGIPVGKHKKSKISTLTTILTKLHAGGKFNNEAYSSSRGTVGIGISVTNALSSKFEAWTYREDDWYYQSFEKGKPKTKVVKCKFPSKIVKSLGALKDRGTIIRYTPDYTIVGNAAKLTDKKVSDWLYDVANLNTGVKIQLITDKLNEVYHNKGGPKQYLKEIIEDENVETIGKPFIFESENLNIALQWTDYEGDDGIVSYINGAYTEGGGTHMQGLYDTLTKAFRTVTIKSLAWTAIDLRFGLLGFINYKLPNAEFDSPTKNRLVTASAKKDVVDILLKPLTKFLRQNQSTARNILKRASEIKKAKDKARELTKAASKIKSKQKLLLPGKLSTASLSTPAYKKELFLLEGESAGGTAKNARDRKFQEVLCLRGKPLNVAKTSLTRAIANKEISDILTAIGVDPSRFGKNKKTQRKEFRIGKIVLLTDSDQDGKHIATLICTLLYIIIPEVFEKKMVYCIDGPLYFANYKDTKYFGYTLKEIQKLLPKGASRSCITRAKGWGEISWQLLRDIAFDVKTRKIFLIKAIKGKDKTKFLKITGEDTTTRKRLLGIL